MNNLHYDVLVIGAGVVGCAIARELSKYQLKIGVVEKEGDVAEEISKANSGVLHAGFNVKPGSLKARFNLEGLNFYPALADILDVPYKLSKKLVIAKNDSELPYLEKLLEQGRQNKCDSLSIIGHEYINSIQPGLSAKYALYSEKTAIISPYELTIALAENAVQNGTSFRFYAEVISIEKEKNFFRTNLSDGTEFLSSFVVNAAGIHAAKIQSMVEDSTVKIYPVRGEYLILDSGSDKLTTAIYPVPPIDGRGLGIHLTPTINGNILIGPSAEYIEDINVANTQKVIAILKQEASLLYPAIADIPVIKTFSGIRPKLFKAGEGDNFRDFIIAESEQVTNFINLFGIESPGLTSAPAIARYVTEEIIGNKIDLIANKQFNPKRHGIKRTKFMTPAQLAKSIENDSNYGKIICRCEHVTKAEILLALNNPLKRNSLNAIKRRTHCMMGRCQSGFCLQRILTILTKELGYAPESIFQNSQNSNILFGQDK